MAVSTGTRIERATAERHANAIARTLGDSTTLVAIAGSIRRGRPDVGDIELVAIPIRRQEPDGLFDTVEVNLLTERIDALIEGGVLANHPIDPKRGDRYSKLIHRPSGLQLDLFSATAETFGLIFLIRTGPADYSRRFVTDLRARALHVKNGQLHHGSLSCGAIPCEVEPTPDERAVFNAAGWPFVAPEDRR